MTRTYPTDHTMPHIEELLTEPPFQAHPQLLAIWPEPFCRIMQEAVTDDLTVKDQYDIGGIYLIARAGEVIGITGYFLYEHDASTLGLRWHGFVPSHRGQHYSEPIIAQVLRAAIEKHPQARTLIELVPLTDYGKPLERHFKTLGFQPVGDCEQYDWADNHWQPYALDIHAFLARQPAVTTAFDTLSM